MELIHREVVLASRVASKHVGKVLGYFTVPELNMEPKAKEGEAKEDEVVLPRPQTFAIMVEYCSNNLKKEMKRPEVKTLSFPFKLLWSLKIVRQLLDALEVFAENQISESKSKH